MNVDVYIQSGINIQVTQSVTQQAIVTPQTGTTVIATSQPSPLYIIGNLPVLVGSGQGGATESWVDAFYYPRDNPSGYATGVDASAFVRHTESGVLVSRGETGQFYPNTNPSGYITNNQIVKFSTSLISGIETQAINYPVTFSTRPTAISCEIENNIDNFIYSHSLTGVSNTGFWICFSDNLSTSGYFLYTTIAI